MFGSKKTAEADIQAVYDTLGELPDPVHVLLVDDDEDQHFAVRTALRDFAAPRFELTAVASHGAGLAELNRGHFDVCLVDFRLGELDGLDLIRSARATGHEVPFVLFTGDVDRKVDLAAMAAGAIDFLPKHRLDRTVLERTLRYAIVQDRVVREVAKAHNRVTGLDEVGTALTAAGPTDATLDRACEIVSARFGFEYVSIYRRSGDDLVLGGSRGYPNPIERMSVDWGAIRHVMDDRMPKLSAVISHEPSQRIDGLRTEYLVPLVAIDYSVGLLVIGSADDDPVGEADAKVITAIGWRIGTALRLYAEMRSLSERVSATQRLELMGRQLQDLPWGAGMWDALLAAARIAVPGARVSLAGVTSESGSSRMDRTAADDGASDFEAELERLAWAALASGTLEVAPSGRGQRLAVPLVVRAQQLGAAVWERPSSVFTESDLDLLRVAEPLLALALAVALAARSQPTEPIRA